MKLKYNALKKKYYPQSFSPQDFKIKIIQYHALFMSFIVHFIFTSIIGFIISFCGKKLYNSKLEK